MLNRKVVSGLTLFFLIIFLIFAWVFYSSQAKSHQAQQEAVRLIETGLHCQRRQKILLDDHF